MIQNRAFIVVTSYIIGILLGVYLKLSIVLLFLFIGIISLIYFRKWNTKTVILLLIILIGFIYTNALYKKYDNKFNGLSNVEVIGTIVSEPKEKEHKYIYKVKIESINGSTKYKDCQLYLNVKKKKTGSNCIKYGNLVCFNGEYKEPNVQRNYLGDDYSFFIKTKMLYGTLETSVSDVKIIKEYNTNFVDFAINSIAKKLKDNLKLLLSDENAYMAIGILLGDKDEISDDVIELFKEGNLYHILAVSGMHISYIVLAFSKLSRFAGKKYVNIFLIVFLLMFIKITGCTPSVMRAGIMAIINLFSKLIHCKHDLKSNICVTLLIILILNPFSLFEMGCILSFAGTIGIIVFNKYIDVTFFKRFPKGKCFDFIKDTIIVSISANILIIPIMIYKFNSIPLVFIISNLLISPIVGATICLILVISIVSLISIRLAYIFSYVLDVLLSVFLNIVKFINLFSWFNITVPTPNVIFIILIYVCIFLLFYISNTYPTKLLALCIKRIFYVIVILIIVFKFVSFFPIGMKIYFVDVGQGDCTLVISESGKRILIDGGGSETSDFDVGKKILVPYLLDRRIMNIDYIMISHFDSDHCKGIFTVLEELNVKNVVISTQGDDYENYKIFKEIVSRKKVNVITANQGDIIKIDNVTFFEILWPQKHQITDNMINNNSLVCMLKYRNFKMLFTGDIESKAEDVIVSKYSKSLKADVLKVAHHGSKSSSTDEFIKLSDSYISLIGVGAENNFGHPNDDVVHKLKNVSNAVLRTDINGEICIMISPKGNIKYKVKIRNRE